MFKLAVTLLALQAAVILATPSKISPALQATFNTKSSVDVMVVLKEATRPILDQIAARKYTNEVAKRTAIRSGLMEFTEASQANILSFLSSRAPSKTARGYWITNRIFIAEATADLVSEIASQFSEVAEIREAIVIPLEETVKVADYKVPITNETEPAWGVARVRAPEAWEAGFEGEGVVVANIDTGVRWNHEALIDNYREAYGWYDPYDGTDISKDFQGHGTHTMGTICGTHGIGVAPKAKWVACRGCGTFACTEDALVRCGQWVTCPTRWDGSEPDCSQAPRVSSNSWGGGQGDPFYNDIVDSWRAANIVPVFAIGNSGPFCRTANSPGDQDNLISVGATNEVDAVTAFSSKGPLINDINVVKPEFSAPGNNIVSASYLDVGGYSSLSGTSMACPHVAGAIAVLLSRNPDLTFDQIEDAFYDNTVQPPIDETPCGNVTDFWPNNSYGWGILDVSSSVGSVS